MQFPVVIDSRCIVPSHKCHVFSPFLIAEDLQFVFKALKIDRTKFETALYAPLQTYHVTVWRNERQSRDQTHDWRVPREDEHTSNQPLYISASAIYMLQATSLYVSYKHPIGGIFCDVVYTQLRITHKRDKRTVIVYSSSRSSSSAVWLNDEQSTTWCNKKRVGDGLSKRKRRSTSVYTRLHSTPASLHFTPQRYSQLTTLPVSYTATRIFSASAAQCVSHWL